MGVRYFAFPGHTLHPINCELPFLRVGSNGDCYICPVFSTKKFQGLILDGDFYKGYQGGMLGPVTMLVDSGELKIVARSPTAGINYHAWVSSRSQLHLVPGLVADFHIKLSGLGSTNNYYAEWALAPTAWGGLLKEQPNNLVFRINASTSSYYVTIWGYKNTVVTYWKTVTEVSSSEGTVRLKVHQDGDMSIYLHEGEGIVNEDEDEIVAKQDFGLAFTRAYVGYVHETEDATNHTVSSEGVYVYYPDRIQLLALQPDVTNLYKGDCEVYDGDPSTTGIPVFHPNHHFNNDPYITNQILKLHLDLDVYAGFKLYCYDYTGTGWILPMNQFYVYGTTRGAYNMYPRLMGFEVINRDYIRVRFQLYDNSLGSWVEGSATMIRGDPVLHLSFDKVDQYEYLRPIWINTVARRFGYSGDIDTLGIADTDLSIGLQNTTMTENYMMVMDPGNLDAIAFMAMQKKPGTRYDIDSTYAGMDLNDIYPSMLPLNFGLGLLGYPWNVLDEYFTEAEDDYHTGTEVYDATASNNYRVDLDAQDEAASHNIITGYLTPGRYLWVIRLKDSDNVWEDCQLRVQRNDTWAYLNQENTTKYHTLTSSWDYYFMIFDVPEDIGSATVIAYVIKRWTDTNTISVDSFAVFPITDGRNFTQDHARSYLRHADRTHFLPWRKTIL